MSDIEGAIDDEWFEEAFDALYPIVYSHRTIEAAAPESHFAAETLGLNKADRVLDLACGNGRHLVHLKKRCGSIMGLDYSPDLLKLAKTNLECRGCLVRGDMRALPFRYEFDAVVNFFTSFGYFQEDEENAAVARNIAVALKPGGRFLIDYLNPEQVRKGLVPESERSVGEYRIQESRWIDETAQRVNKRTQVWHDGHLVARYGESVRLYGVECLREIIGSAGLELRRIYGDYCDTEYSRDSPRMILVGERVR